MSLKVTCTRRLQFCAGHRVFGHENKCGNLHGHNYVVFITAEIRDHGSLDVTDILGRVVDFSVLKEKYSRFIEQCWDHGFILNVMDYEAIAAVLSVNNNGTGEPSKLWLMGANPTAENMALALLEMGPALMVDAGHHEIIITKVVVHETENCFAEVSL